MTVPGKTMLQGWKEIADYVSRDERTVKRWEKQRQLPVRRMPGSGRTNVYVLVAELDQWLGRPSPPEAQPIAPLITQPADPPAAPGHPAQLAPARRWGLRWGLSGALALVSATALLTLYTHRANNVAMAAPRYVSRVPGVDDLYLHGVYLYEQHTPAALAQARQALQQAVAKDPADAPAWSALAGATLMLQQFGALPMAQGFDEASAAARRALALDPSLADAHATLAFADFFGSRDRVTAEREFRHALAFDPSSATAHLRYGLMLLDLRRFPEAIAEFDTALRLQPSSTPIVASRAVALGFSGHRDAAIEVLQAVAAHQPQDPIVFRDLAALAIMQPHDIPLFLDSSRRDQQIEHGAVPLPWMDAASAAYRSGGERAMWQAIAAAESKDPVPTSLAAKALAQLGQSSAALDILEADTKRPEAATSSLALDPLLYEPLHNDPRYQALLARVGLWPLQ